MKEAKKTLLRVIGIMWGLAAVVLIVGAILFAIHPFPYFPYVSGEVLGTLVSGLLMWHRFNTLDVELDMAKKNAIRHLRMQASVRSLISLLTLLLCLRDCLPPRRRHSCIRSFSGKNRIWRNKLYTDICLKKRERRLRLG